MRHLSITLVIVLALISIQACKKQDTFTEKTIVGIWELKTVSGGVGGLTYNFSHGNGYILKFSDSTFEQYVSGAITDYGSYYVVKDTVSCDIFKHNIIFHGQNGTINQRLYIVSDDLALNDGCRFADGYNRHYVRL
jgi:hypothetical protein